ncbi:hypothetical protein LPB86_20405 [Pedobacter sp. MC2016-14]|uniref:hypothetical protein n=1 Tax=Pedobacter sp. MC2016-14 TaxID=2897327 RepID=UPI001E5697B8|nr:hypothetical protein [Pedobacter sp. MC2016-14]MCD0490611.1 hypothetical protein [Pedobacter sp. MC2016-14]
METNNPNPQPGAAQVPAQQVGTEMNAVEKIELPTEGEAIHFFKTVKDRLLDVNRWSEIAGVEKAHFFLTDASGGLVQRTALSGDHIRIDIPGPGTAAGEGYDWVVLEEVNAQLLDDVEVISITARPSRNPLKADPAIAHFLTDEATSTFQVKRIGNVIFAEEHGRNEVANNDTGNGLDNLRNTLVGWAAKIGFSYPQWKALVKGLLVK